MSATLLRTCRTSSTLPETLAESMTMPVQDETLRRRRLDAATEPSEPLEELVAEPVRAAAAAFKKDD